MALKLLPEELTSVPKGLAGKTDWKETQSAFKAATVMPLEPRPQRQHCCSTVLWAFRRRQHDATHDRVWTQRHAYVFDVQIAMKHMLGATGTGFTNGMPIDSSRTGTCVRGLGMGCQPWWLGHWQEGMPRGHALARD